MRGVAVGACDPKDLATVRRERGRRRSAPPTLRLLSLAILTLLLPLAAVGPVSAQDEPPIVPIDGSGPVVAEAGDPADAGLAAEDEAVAQIAPGTEPVDIAAPEGGPAAPASTLANWSPPTTVYVPDTGQTVDGVFLDLWRGWGGATGFGNPITPELEENGRIVQYYGYARLEYWPADPNGEVVKFGDLGSELRPPLLRRGLPGAGEAASETAGFARAWLPIEAEAVGADATGWQFSAATNHSLSGDFLAFWETTGGDTFLGDPLTEPYQLAGISYQVFERGQIAQEPGGLPSLVPAGELAVARRGIDTSPVAQADVPTYSEALFVPPPDPTPTPTPATEGGTPAENEPAAGSVQVDPNAEKWLQVSIAQQYAVARQGDAVLWEGYVSTGKPDFDTPTGTFFVNSKLPVQDMEGVLGGEYYNVPEVPSVMYFTDRGHAIHGTYWHNNFGTPMSHGCINLPMDVAAWMYDWAPVGLRVEIVP